MSKNNANNASEAEIEEMIKQQIKNNKWYPDTRNPFSKEDTCPNCGYCPTCGRGNRGYPYDKIWMSAKDPWDTYLVERTDIYKQSTPGSGVY